MITTTKERPILFKGPMVRALLDGSKTQTRRICKSQPYSNGFHFDGHEILCHNDYLPPSAMLMDYRDGGQAFTTSNMEGWDFCCPYGQPGDRLWVRETCAGEELSSGQDGVRYGADDAFIPIKDSPSAAIDWLKLHTYGLKSGQQPDSLVGRKVPSIHMPRWASRIPLEIVSVHVERLQDCSKKDAIAEGIHRYEHFWRDAEYPLDDVAYEPVKGWPTRYSCPIQAYQALWEQINGAGSWDANPWVWVVEFKRVEA